jgi:DNA-binding XRE family transcriptional regulator
MEQQEKSMGAMAAPPDAPAKSDASKSESQKEAHRSGAEPAARPARHVADSREVAVTKPKAKKSARRNRLRETRIEKMMSKAELARRANLSVLTIDRVEKGLGCRMDTKRKILEALGLSLADRVRVFGEEE